MAGLIDGLTTSQQLELIYIGYFNRAADGAGFAFWAGQNVQAQASGQSAATSLTNIANSFTPQPETLALYPFLGSASNLASPAGQASLTTLINNVFSNLFGHTADPGGLTYWLGQITSGAVGLGAAILAIANGATGADAIELQNKITVAVDFTTRTQAAGLGTSSASFLAAAHSVLTGVDGTSLNDASVTAGITATTTFIASLTVQPPSPLTLMLGTDNLTTSTTGAVFTAPLAFNGGTGTQIQTLQSGDSVADTANDGTLTATLNAGVLVTGFTMSGVKTLNVTANNAAGTGDGFSGTITGLQVVNNNSSTEPVILGATANGLKTALTTYNSNNVASTPGSGFAAFIAAAALSGNSDAITISLTGNLGAANTTGTGASSVSVLVFAPDAGANGYETWTITSNNAEFLYLGQSQGAGGLIGSGLGSGAHIVLNGAGSVELNAGTAGDWANLKTIDATAETGSVTLTGAAANAAGAYGSAAGTVFAGLLTSGASIIAPTSIKGSTTAANFVDLSGLTLANTDAMTAVTGNTATGITNTLILTNAVVEQTAALSGESGFQVIGDSDLAAGTINMANFAGADELKLFGPSTVGAGTVTIDGGPTSFVLDLSGDVGPAASGVFVVNGPTGTTDQFHLILGSTTNLVGGGGGLQSLANSFATLTITGYEAVDITNNVGNGATSDFVGGISLTPSAGGGSAITFDGKGFLSVSSIALGLGGGSITDDITGNQLWFGTTNAAVISEGASAGGLAQFAAETGNSGNTGISITVLSGAGTVNHLIGYCRRRHD